MLSLDIDHYLAVRRAAGFQLKVQEGLLRHFARYAADRSETHVCRQTAIDPPGPDWDGVIRMQSK
jgi:hypothetical protein